MKHKANRVIETLPSTTLALWRQATDEDWAAKHKHVQQQVNGGNEMPSRYKKPSETKTQRGTGIDCQQKKKKNHLLFKIKGTTLHTQHRSRESWL